VTTGSLISTTTLACPKINLPTELPFPIASSSSEHRNSILPVAQMKALQMFFDSSPSFSTSIQSLYTLIISHPPTLNWSKPLSCHT
jgi:hypothetical protein